MPALEIDETPKPVLSWALLPSVLLSGSALFLYPLRDDWRLLGYGVLAVALLLAWFIGRQLFRDLLLIAVGMLIVSLVSVKADISWGNFFLVGFILAAAVATPYLLSRFVFKDRVIRFPWRAGRK